VTPEETVQQKFSQLRETMHERMTRLWAGAEAEAIGRGGIAIVARATGLAISTVTKGRNEVRAGATVEGLVKVRRRGAGRKAVETANPELLPALEKLVDPVTRGDPESPLRWTGKGTRALAVALSKASGKSVGERTVARLLAKLGYSLQGTHKSVEGAQHKDRDAQFKFINDAAVQCLKSGIPFLSVDTKKKELVGNFRNAGQDWRPKDKPDLVDVHDFPSDAIGKAIPYGVLDVADNSAFVNVGTDHDTPVFAVQSIETWWTDFGDARYPRAREIFITADAGGSNGYRSRVWKARLQAFADKYRLRVHVSHFPPGTSKWNKIEHRLFSFITINWRGRPLRTYETVVNLIGNTTTKAGLVVRAALDQGSYPIGQKVSESDMRLLRIVREEFHGDWNYSILPRPRR
jgi:transposase